MAGLEKLLKGAVFEEGRNDRLVMWYHKRSGLIYHFAPHRPEKYDPGFTEVVYMNVEFVVLGFPCLFPLPPEDGDDYNTIEFNTGLGMITRRLDRYAKKVKKKLEKIKEEHERLRNPMRIFGGKGQGWGFTPGSNPQP